MYVAAFVIPVPADRMEDYRRWAENSAAVFGRYGCVEIVGGFTPIAVMGRD
jgi:uncharacterized protein YbaA (DUF1428 family)